MITIENLNLNNVEAVSQIEKEMIETPWGLNALKKEIENKNAFYAVIKNDDKVLGYGGIWFSIGTSDITNIAVLKEERRKGYGSIILNELIKKAIENKCYEINLEVNENNEGAILLYEKCGFLKVGLRKKYYNNKDNAIIMQFNEEK